MDTTRRDVLKLGIAVAGITAGLRAQASAEGVTAPPTPTSIRRECVWNGDCDQWRHDR
jgi:hypothetical protein